MRIAFRPRVIPVLLVLLALPAAAVRAAEPDACPLHSIGPYGAWSRGEQLAWEAIRKGEAVNLLEPQPDRQHPSTEPAARELGPWFLQTLLGHPACVKAIGELGVYIIGGEFPRDVFVQGLSISVPVVITGAHFAGRLSFTETRFEQSLHLVYSRVDSVLEMKGVHAGLDLDLQRNALSALDFYSVTVGRNLNLSHSGPLADTVEPVVPAGGDPEVTAKLTNVHVQQHLYLGGSQFAGLNLYGSRIDGDLDAGDARLTRPLLAPGLRVGGRLRLAGVRTDALELMHADITEDLDLSGIAGYAGFGHEGGAAAAYLRLGGMRVGRSLWLVGARAVGVDLRGATIGQSLLIEDTTLSGSLLLDEAAIGRRLVLRAGSGPARIAARGLETGDLVLAAPCLPTLELAAVRIADSLDLTAAGWRADARLDLTNASVQRFEDTGTTKADAGAGPCRTPEPGSGSWPRHIELNGFAYAQLGADAQRSGEAWTDWLARQEHFSKLPYQQLADRLRAVGRGDAANEVLYTMRVRDLDRTPLSLGKIWGLIELNLTGFGFHKERALVPLLLLIALGVLFAAPQYAVTPLPDPWTVPRRIKYSTQALVPMIDTLFPKLVALLPLPKIDEAAYAQIDAAWRERDLAWHYFRLHRMLGLLLTVALIVSLFGLIA